MASSTRTPMNHNGSPRRWMISLNIATQVVALSLILLMCNWLVARHYLRFDWTRSSYYQLSEKTRNILAGLEQPLRIIVFMPSSDERGYVHKVIEDTRHLLREFQYYGRDNVRVEFVDTQRDLVRTRALVAQFKVDPQQPDVVIFASGDRSKFVTINEIVDVEMTGTILRPEKPRIKAFKGEGVFLAAIQAITEEAPPAVYFMTGQGERDPNSTDPQSGLSLLATYMKRDNLKVGVWNLQQQMLTDQRLPADAEALIVAGPVTRYSPEAVAELERYLAKNGRLLVMLDPETYTGLEPLLEQWGVRVDDNLVVARTVTQSFMMEALGTDYAAHPITERLSNINTSFVFSRSVRRAPDETAPGRDRPRLTELVKTPAAYWGESDYRTRPFTFDKNVDLAGPVSLAVAAESSMPAGVDIGTARLVVIGTSRFVTDGYITNWRGNLDFTMNALNWLLKRELNIAVSHKIPDEFSLGMTSQQVQWLTSLVVAVLPALVAGLGLLVWMQRRS